MARGQSANGRNFENTDLLVKSTDVSPLALLVSVCSTFMESMQMYFIYKISGDESLHNHFKFLAVSNPSSQSVVCRQNALRSDSNKITSIQTAVFIMSFLLIVPFRPPIYFKGLTKTIVCPVT